MIGDSCVISAAVISAISWVCVCVVGAVNDGKCSLRWSATVSVVQESMWWTRFVTLMF